MVKGKGSRVQGKGSKVRIELGSEYGRIRLDKVTIVYKGATTTSHLDSKTNQGLLKRVNGQR